jgi:hypothetical protein
MTDAFKKLYQGQPTDTTATLYTVPGSTTAILRHIRIVNNDTIAGTITLYDDGTADSNIILPTTTIPAGGYIELDVFICMAAAVTLKGKAHASSKVTVTVYGVEIT